MAPRHSMIRQEGASTRADAHDLARSAGRAVALVTALRRLRRRPWINRNGEHQEVVTVSHLVRRGDEPPQKG